MKKPKKRVVRAWGVYLLGRMSPHDYRLPVYRTRKMAREDYSGSGFSIRPVEIREVHKPRGKK